MTIEIFDEPRRNNGLKPVTQADIDALANLPRSEPIFPMWVKFKMETDIDVDYHGNFTLDYHQKIDVLCSDSKIRRMRTYTTNGKNFQLNGSVIVRGITVSGVASLKLDGQGTWVFTHNPDQVNSDRLPPWPVEG